MGQTQSYLVEFISNPSNHPAIAITAAAAIGIFAYSRRPKNKNLQSDAQQPKDVVVLHQLPRPPFKGYPNFSAPCMKLETYLRMTGVKYIVKEVLPSTGPKKKVPYITLNGETIADSQLIIWHLQKIKLPGYTDIDAHLTTDEKILVDSVRLLAEEILYRHIGWERWANPKNAKATRDSIFHDIPFPMRYLVFSIVQKNNTKASQMHGFGRFTHSEQLQFSFRAIDRLSELLGDKRYMLGDKPCSLDAIVFGELMDVTKAHEYWPDIPTGGYLKTKENLVKYVQRMFNEYFPLAE
ncbi:hypothetical protein HK098_007468 [Nowakowskiella sp. JEL0407]|nr:hypothetical protein HK098_007468 [Nowakowskiella sp. JEL0407]